jgi:pyruvate kinase
MDVIHMLKQKKILKKGDKVINIGSMPLADKGRANMVKVTVVE